MKGLFSVVLAFLLAAVVSAFSVAPDFTNNGYSNANGKWMTYASGIAYCDEMSILKWNCTTCQQPESPFYKSHVGDRFVISDPKKFSQAYVTRLDNAILIGFRGTVPSSFKNWLSDMWASKSKSFYCKECKVHKGFHDIWLRLKDKVFEAVYDILKETPPGEINGMLIAGHSLGGAVATLAALEFAERFGIPTQVYTQGQPRVGNQAFVDMYKNYVQAHYRLVHYHDIVPTVPPHFLGFRHVPLEIFYDEAMDNFQVCDGSGEDPKCSTSGKSINDHTHYFNQHVSYMACPWGH
eukprot:TRINITY_DN1827_c0_g1_i1.p1 TRINITY_DN1827_c0_g1~~TRINITY_DN1827_c0_g1_i1.p1  ORF type:complete len:294 (+),score=69.98 TRINITY_DN1827_c0_g1_i1:84-965(+)